MVLAHIHFFHVRLHTDTQLIDNLKHTFYDFRSLQMFWNPLRLVCIYDMILYIVFNCRVFQIEIIPVHAFLGNRTHVFGVASVILYFETIQIMNYYKLVVQWY